MRFAAFSGQRHAGPIPFSGRRDAGPIAATGWPKNPRPPADWPVG